MNKDREIISEETWEARCRYLEEHMDALVSDLDVAQAEIKALKKEIQKHLADFSSLKLKAAAISLQLWEGNNNA